MLELSRIIVYASFNDVFAKKTECLDAIMSFYQIFEPNLVISNSAGADSVLFCSISWYDTTVRL
jgi:hypothetical protein